MKAEFVNPIIESVQELISTTLGAQARRGKIGVTDAPRGPGELVALIGISGRATGSVALSMPEQTALGMVGKFKSESYDSTTDEVIDGIGKMVNLLADGAKEKMDVEGETPMELSLPTVISGDSYSVKYPTKTTWIHVPYECEFGPFYVRITREEE